MADDQQSILRYLVQTGSITQYERRTGHWARQRHARQPPQQGSREPHRRAARNNYFLWFTTWSLSCDSYDINEEDSSITERINAFMDAECQRSFTVNERGEQEHVLHVHNVSELKDSACYAWMAWRMRQCCSSSRVSVCVKRIHGGSLGSFHGMLGYITKGT